MSLLNEGWRVIVFFFHSLFQSTYEDILILLPLSSLLPFSCDSLILCPSYGLRVSPHFIDSVGALPYPSPELHSAWPIPIRQKPCHEQKSHCDQTCFQLPMSLLALTAPSAGPFEEGWGFSLSQQRKGLMNADDTGQGGVCWWQGLWGWRDTWTLTLMERKLGMGEASSSVIFKLRSLLEWYLKKWSSWVRTEI